VRAFYGNDYIDVEANQFDREFWESVHAVVRITPLKLVVLSVDPAQLPQRIQKCHIERGRRTSSKVSNSIYLSRLLCPSQSCRDQAAGDSAQERSPVNH
jgi:hypothetical protein